MDAILAFPLAYYIARVAKPRTRTLLLVAVLLPLWSSYLVRIYAWRTILGHDGALNWTLNKIGLPDVNLLYTNWGMWIVFTYIWLPFMVIPVYAALERMPDNFLEASADLGARAGARSGACCCRSRCPGSSPARSSHSPSPSVTSSRHS